MFSFLPGSPGMKKGRRIHDVEDPPALAVPPYLNDI